MRRRVLTGGVLFGVLGPAVLLTAMRVLQPPGAAATVLVTFTPLAIPLYVVGALALVAIWRGGHRRRHALAAVAAAGLLVLHLGWVAPRFVGSGRDAGPEAVPLHVMTFNTLRGGADPERILAVVRAERVDILILQEITPALVRELDEGGIAALLPHRAGRAAPGVHGTVVWSAGRIGKVVELGGVLDAWAITVDVLGRPLRVHAIHPPPPTMYAEWARDLRRFADNAADDGAHLVAGDFNATLDHRPMGRFAEAGFVDAAQIANAGLAPTWPANRRRFLGVRLPRFAAIDHILVCDEFAVDGVSVVAIPGSDHAAVVARLRWGR